MKLSVVVPLQTTQLWMLRLLYNSNWQVRKTLREICEAFQAGRRFPPDKVHGFVVTVKGLYDEPRLGANRQIDIEINRWVLKCLIEIGSSSDLSWFAQKASSCADEENSIWIAIGIIKFSSELHAAKRRLEPLHLSATQHDLAICMANKLEFYEERQGLKIELAEKIEILIACVAFAVRRDLKGVFEPRFDQKEQLTVLNEHHDHHVRQYSIYAMWRLPGVGFSDARIKLSDVADQDISVRRWLYELILKEEKSIHVDLDFWRGVSENECSEEALEGFANGIYTQFADGLPDIVHNVMAQNHSSDRVRLGMLRHMCKNCEEDQSYYEVALAEFRRSPVDSVLRAVCIDASIGTKLFREFKIVEFEGAMPDLFSNGDIVMGDKISGDKVTIGSNQIYTKGDNNNIASGSWRQSISKNDKAIDALIAALKEHGKTKEEEDLKVDLEEIKRNPSETLLERVVSRLKSVGAGMTVAKEIFEASTPLIDAWTN